MCGERLHVAWFPAPYLGNNRRFIVSLDESCTDGSLACMHPACGIGKLGEIDVGSRRLCDDMAKHHISYRLHGGEYKKRTW